MQDIATSFEAYLLTQKCVAHNTFVAYQRDIKEFICLAQHQGINSLEALTQDHITAYLVALQTNQISARTIARKISALRLFFAYIHNKYGYSCHTLELITPQIPKKLPRYCTVSEITEILQASSQDTTNIGKRNSVIVHLLYVSGIRVSELVSLRISDIHFDTGILDICGKGGKMRAVPLAHEMLTLLRWYIQNIREQLLPQASIFLFATCYKRQIKPLSRHMVWKIIKNILQKTSINKGVSPHTFRHSLATHGLEQGWDLRSLQLLLGHENISTVEIYTHVEISHLRKSYDKKLSIKPNNSFFIR